MAVEVSFTDRFWQSVNKLQGAEIKQVTEAVEQLGRDPQASGLRLKPIQGDKTGRKYSCRASQDLRILVFKEASVLLLAHAGHHDAVYEVARRVDILHNAGAGRIVIVERADQSAERVVAPPLPVAEPGGPRPFDHWADAELREASLSDEQLHAIRSCRTEDDIAGLDFDDETLLRVFDLLGQTPEQWRTPSMTGDEDRAERFRQAIVEHGALAGISPLFTADELAKLSSAPIEEWMVFLHPDQRAAVTRRHAGPARVRGSAGTGKTVVALHRAAELIRRFHDEEPVGARTVLFTTYIASLPKVFERLYHRLPQTAASDDIQFWNVDRLAHRVCVEAGDRPTIDPRVVDSSWAKVWKDSPLRSAGFSPSYVQDEIRQVIKGRGLRDLDAYLNVERTGRRTRFPEATRRQVWELKEGWGARLALEGVSDFHDIVLRARDHARRLRAPRYRSALLDEAQDLTLVGLQLIRALVNGPDAVDRPDGLLIVGDGAQRIYAGGFTLRQAGIEVRGRTTVLRTNYRNTKEIIQAAMAVAGSDQVDDLGDSYARGEADADAARSGMRPVLVSCDSGADELNYVVDRIQDLVSYGAIGYGDVGVFTATNKQVEVAMEHLRLAGVPTMKLQDYDGTPIDKVKIGTHFRAKGLEFKVVLLPHLSAAEYPRKPYPGQPEDEVAEQRSLALSQLFVAMTRARDGLFLLTSGDPSPLLGSLDHFEIVDA